MYSLKFQFWLISTLKKFSSTKIKLLGKFTPPEYVYSSITPIDLESEDKEEYLITYMVKSDSGTNTSVSGSFTITSFLLKETTIRKACFLSTIIF